MLLLRHISVHYSGFIINQALGTPEVRFIILNNSLNSHKSWVMDVQVKVFVNSRTF